MQLYLLRQRELRMRSLPAQVSGHFVLEYTDEGGADTVLAHIHARNGKWCLSENSNVQIEGSGAIPGKFREFELFENSLYYLRTDRRETMVLMVEPDSANRSRYKLYRVPAGGIVDVGQADFNQIQFSHRYVHSRTHLRICYRDGMPEAVEDHSDGTNPVYLNGRSFRGRQETAIGDVIFLVGMKLVLGKGFIAVNDPDGLTNVHLEPQPQGLFIPEQTEDRECEGTYFSSAPRARKEFIHRSFSIEKPPEGIPENDTPWIVMLGPSLTMAMGSLFSSVITINNVLASGGGISSAMPSLITALVMVTGSAVWPVIARRVQQRSRIRKAAIASDDYEAYLKDLQNQIEEAARLQAEILRENNPLVDACADMILEVREMLWARSTRHKDFLDVMIGTGDLPLDADFSYPERGYHSQISPSAKDMYDLVAREHVVRDVPVTLPLKGAGIVGIIGDRPDVVSFTKALLLELTAMHNYEDLKIIFLYDEKERSTWKFVKWIPHLWNDERTFRYLASTPDEVRLLSEHIGSPRAVRESGKRENNGPHYLIFAADKNLAERAQSIKEFCQSPDDGNMTVIALYNERQHLPKACSYVIDLIHSAERTRSPEKYRDCAATLADYNDITGQRIVCRERIGYDGDPEDIFIRMANIRLDSPTQTKQLPAQLTFMEMLGLGKAEHLDLLRRWRENDPVNSLAAPIGVDADGYYVYLDIHDKQHGPHGAVAGMTGSGKSELLISAIASLAVNYSPEDVAFVFIDFKGGGMSDIFRSLPHTAGMITNLDGNELKRSFLAIENELAKRQRLFKEISERKKISNIDINKYQKLRREDSSLKPLPHLVLIADEFAELRQQQGDFMGQLIRIARIGRSLGIHLILATQKPNGVVDDQIKSNIRFKICLKVQDKSDSTGMIGRPDATLITNPGRFYLQVGNDELFEYGQSPWSGATYTPTEHPRKNVCDHIDVIDQQGRVICRETVPAGPRIPGVPEKQIDALVEFIREVAEQNGLRSEKLWRDPLPGPADEKKISVFDTTISPFVLNPIVGMYDDLINQKQLPLTVPFTIQGNALLYGAGGSGKLEFLNRMLVSLMEHHSPEEVSFCIGDFDAGALSAFEESSYTRAYVGAGDREGLSRMLGGVMYELTDRRSRMRKFGGDYGNYIRSSGKTLPNLLLVIHNFQNLAESDPEARQKLCQIAREGTQYGIYMIVTGTAANSIPYSMQPLFKNVYTLRQNTDDQYREILGKTGGIVPDRFRGRGLVQADGTVCEFQTEMIFDGAESVYESIRRFCREMDQKWTGAAAEPEQEAMQSPQEETGLVYALDAVPVARGMSWDLTADTFTLVCHDDLHAAQTDTLLRAIRRCVPDEGRLMEITADAAQIHSSVEELWAMMKARAELGLAAREAGRPIPLFEPVVIILHDPARITDTAAEEDRVHLAAMIRKLKPSYRMFFVLLSHQHSLWQLTQPKCLNGIFPVARGLVLDTDRGARSLFREDIDFRGSAAAPWGFLVEDGTARLAEFYDDGKEKNR